MKIKQFIIAVCIGTMFAACSSKEDYSLLNDDNVIRLTVGINELQTRASGGNSSHNNYFATGEKIRVYMKENGTTNNVTGIGSGGYSIFTNNGSCTSSDTPMFPESNGVDITAVYPEDVANDATSFSISQNQYIDEEYLKSDLMTANVTNHKRANGFAELQFTHLLSKVIIKINPGNTGVDVSSIKSASMYVPHISIPISWSQTGGWSLGTITEPARVGGHEIIVANNEAYTSAGYSAILLPGTIPAGYEFLAFGVGDTSLYSFTNSDPIVLSPGCVHTFTFTMVNDKLQLGSTIINTWGNGTGNSYNIEPLY